jgi:hypothetical protein
MVAEVTTRAFREDGATRSNESKCLRIIIRCSPISDCEARPAIQEYAQVETILYPVKLDFIKEINNAAARAIEKWNKRP